MDEYSLNQVLVDEHCVKVAKQMNRPIVCKSVVDLSLESGSPDRLLSLAECLEVVQNKNIGKQIDVVVDELDGEDLNGEEITKLRTKLECAEYESSLFLISLQSCQKERKLEHDGMIQNETKLNLKALGIQIFQLEKSMRYTSNINSAVTNSLDKVQKKPNIYHFDIPKQEETTEAQEKSSKAHSVNVTHPVDSDNEDHNYTNIVVADQTVQKPSVMTVSTMKMDSTLQSLEANGNSITKLTSHFKYFKIKGSGVNIQGDIPNLMRLSNKTNVSVLSFFLKEYCEKESKILIICNTKDMIALAEAALKTLALSYVEYTYCIKRLPAPTTLVKKSILNKWRNEKQVLLTDCRCCRGMECQEVIHNS